jgi:hypothetical protein
MQTSPLGGRFEMKHLSRESIEDTPLASDTKPCGSFWSQLVCGTRLFAGAMRTVDRAADRLGHPCHFRIPSPQSMLTAIRQASGILQVYANEASLFRVVPCYIKMRFNW